MDSALLNSFQSQVDIVQQSMTGSSDTFSNSLQNAELEDQRKPRWGPSNKGAQELAKLYSRGGCGGILADFCISVLVI